MMIGNKMGQMRDQDRDDIASNVQSECNVNIQSKKYKCTYPECNASFLRPSRLERHLRSHTGERPYTCNYPRCTKSYTNSSHLKRHLETHSSIKKVYQCTQCSMTISYLHNLKRHYKRMHSEDKKISCKECGKIFNKRYQFVEHQIAHSASTSYKCDKCEKSFMNFNRLKRHQKSHEKNYTCPIPECSEVFNKWLLLCAHKKAKHVTNHKCNHCNKTFLSKTKLKVHLKIHSEDRLIIPCPYDNCHKAYFSKYNLEQHVRSKHLGEKFYCDICSVGLVSKQKLIEHIQRHHEFKKKRKPKRVQSKKRKDAGIPKKSELIKLIGLNLPYNLEKMVKERETLLTI